MLTGILCQVFSLHKLLPSFFSRAILSYSHSQVSDLWGKPFDLFFLKRSFSQQLLPKERVYFKVQTLQADGSGGPTFEPASQHCMLC